MTQRPRLPPEAAGASSSYIRNGELHVSWEVSSYNKFVSKKNSLQTYSFLWYRGKDI